MGLSGNDIINGGSGRDYIRGGSGDDIIDGGSEGDYLDGGDGNDTLNGNAGEDILAGKRGRDILDGGIDDDVLVGGINDDRVIAHGNGRDRILADNGDHLWHGEEDSLSLLNIQQNQQARTLHHASIARNDSNINCNRSWARPPEPDSTGESIVKFLSKIMAGGHDQGSALADAYEELNNERIRERAISEVVSSRQDNNFHMNELQNQREATDSYIRQVLEFERLSETDWQAGAYQ